MQLHRAFREDDDEEATKVMLHFASMITCGTYCKGAVAFLNAVRLAVILKKEQQGAELQQTTDRSGWDVR